MTKSERQEMFGDSESGYLWCLHCERTYADGEFRVEQRGGEAYQMCLYEDCDGDAVIDAWDWNKVRDDHEEYPERPERGKVYPLYSK